MLVWRKRRIGLVLGVIGMLLGILLMISGLICLFFHPEKGLYLIGVEIVAVTMCVAVHYLKELLYCPYNESIFRASFARNGDWVMYHIAHDGGRKVLELDDTDLLIRLAQLDILCYLYDTWHVLFPACYYKIAYEPIKREKTLHVWDNAEKKRICKDPNCEVLFPKDGKVPNCLMVYEDYVEFVYREEYDENVHH